MHKANLVAVEVVTGDVGWQVGSLLLQGFGITFGGMIDSDKGRTHKQEVG